MAAARFPASSIVPPRPSRTTPADYCTKLFVLAAAGLSSATSHVLHHRASSTPRPERRLRLHDPFIARDKYYLKRSITSPSSPKVDGKPTSSLQGPIARSSVLNQDAFASRGVALPPPIGPNASPSPPPPPSPRCDQPDMWGLRAAK